MITKFEVNKRMDEMDSHISFIQIEWEFDNNAIINFRMRRILF